jgi:catechol-2,3-dioxygenase
MPLRLRNIAVDCNDLDSMAGFWSELLSYEMLSRTESELILAPDSSARPRASA